MSTIANSLGLTRGGPERRLALIVDANAMTRKVITSVVVDNGYDTISTTDGAEAVELSARHRPDDRVYGSRLPLPEPSRHRIGQARPGEGGRLEWNPVGGQPTPVDRGLDPFFAQTTEARNQPENLSLQRMPRVGVVTGRVAEQGARQQDSGVIPRAVAVQGGRLAPRLPQILGGSIAERRMGTTGEVLDIEAAKLEQSRDTLRMEKRPGMRSAKEGQVIGLEIESRVTSRHHQRHVDTNGKVTQWDREVQ